MIGPATTRRRGLPPAFRHRNFRLYWTGQLVSLVGTHMQRAAQAWLVLTLSDDPFMLGLLVVAQWGPVLALGLFGGIVADSVPKRPTIVATQTVAMVLAFLLAALVATGVAELWHVLGLALLLDHERLPGRDVESARNAGPAGSLAIGGACTVAVGVLAAVARSTHDAPDINLAGAP